MSWRFDENIDAVDGDDGMFLFKSLDAVNHRRFRALPGTSADAVDIILAASSATLSVFSAG